MCTAVLSSFQSVTLPIMFEYLSVPGSLALDYTVLSYYILDVTVFLSEVVPSGQ